MDYVFGSQIIVSFMNGWQDNEHGYEKEYLNYYFKELESAVKQLGAVVEFKYLKMEWESMYAIAWTDFTRFLLGWMPIHEKINTYSRKLAERTMKIIYDEEKLSVR